MLKQLNTFQRLLDSTPLATQLVLDGSVASLFVCLAPRCGYVNILFGH